MYCIHTHCIQAKAIKINDAFREAVGRERFETKLSQDPKASECTSINPRVPWGTLEEDEGSCK